MGLLLTLGCYMVAFSPSAAIFGRIIAPDPLKIILFVFGAFMWLVSHLLTSFLWFTLYPLRSHLWFSLVVSLLLQEAARIACFVLLKKAQKGLDALSHQDARGHSGVRGVMSLVNSRHLLAVVCGTGFGVASSLFLSMNVFAALSGSGVFGGLPQVLKGGERNPLFSRLLPLHLSLSAMLLTLLHVTWTVMVWDSCHRYSLSQSSPPAALVQLEWAKSFAIAMLGHTISNATSYFSALGWPSIAITTKVVVLLFSICYSYTIIRHDNVVGLLREIGLALRDWLTLASLRRHLKLGWTSTNTRGSSASDLARTPIRADENGEGVVVRDTVVSNDTRKRGATRT